MKSLFILSFRFYFVFFLVILAFCSLGVRLVHLQVINAEKYSQIANGARKNFIPLQARRGDVVDRKGNLLATTRSVVEVGMDPHSISKEDRSKFDDLARFLDLEVGELHKAADKLTRKSQDNGEIRNVRWVKLREEVDEKVYRDIRKLGVKGVYGNFKHSRLYPNRSLASHVLGFVNKEGTATMGVERFADYYLKGQDGWLESEKDGRRRELAHARSREIQPVNGHDVFLTLDQRLQSAVEFEIQALVDQYNPKGATVIISRPSDGTILALANYPTFDLNEFYNTKRYPISNQRNLAITDMLEPGSTFKIVSASAVLNEGLVQTTDLFPTGLAEVNYKDRMLRLPKDSHHYDELSMEQIVVKSSNRGAAHLGLILGEERLYSYASDFGFGRVTDFGFSGEIPGTLHPVDHWDRLTITRMPMGHAISATPMQIHFAMSVIANKGILMKPRIIDRISDDQGFNLIEYQSVAKKRVIEESVAEQMALMLGDVVKRQGTARRAAIKGYSVGGKTGTTQKIIKGQYSHSKHVASFSGFLPLHDPEVIITVIVDEPQLKSRVGYGGTVAAPAFKNIAQACIQYLGIRPTEYSEDWVASSPNP